MGRAMIPVGGASRHNPGMKTLASLLLPGCALVMSGCTVTPLNEVEALERARFKAWVAADTSAMRPMLGDDLVYCHSTGHCQNKEEIIAAIGSRATIYHSMDVIDMQPREIGGVVIINGKLNYRVETGGKMTEAQGVYTDIYAKRNGRWQLVSWQSTRLP
jgi:ketosteroid isomerase-like protein